jgi:sugar phosphate isomerase/epimerase
MSSPWSRRAFLSAVRAVGAVGAMLPARLRAATSPFQVSVLTDEIGQDFGHALEVAREFGLGYVELRELWDKNVTRLDAAEIDEARALLRRFDLRVTAIASPVFKVGWPGAPASPFQPKQVDFTADFTFDQQDALLDHSLDLARAFGTDQVRVFDFWRIDDQAPYRAAIDERLREAAVRAGTRGLTLVLENEYACNTATGAEAARTLAAVPSPCLKLNWDPANAAMRGEVAYPDGYRRLPASRVGHVHCKNVARTAGGGFEWAEMARGLIDWVAQFRALAADGYRGAVTLETHWRGAGTAEDSTRRCWAAMKRQLAEAGIHP